MSPRTGRPKSNDPKQHQISVRMNDSEIERLDAYCEKNGKQRANTVREAVIEFLERHEK